MDQVHFVGVDDALHFEVGGEGAFGILQRQEVEIFRQRAQLLEARGRAQQKIFVHRIDAAQRAHDVANVGRKTKLVHPSHVDGDAHLRLVYLQERSGGNGKQAFPGKRLAAQAIVWRGGFTGKSMVARSTERLTGWLHSRLATIDLWNNR